jgi:hypothetical protein
MENRCSDIKGTIIFETESEGFKARLTFQFERILF